ncbi:hypothetical protein UPYG_G00024540 [Umbra pygmaea]|uniref:CCHC-type domain-containing protein n=1 Tax=Umbra pygmaea TaxID=75934 RepID=A0ABD0Y8Q2_UMBPY
MEGSSDGSGDIADVGGNFKESPYVRRKKKHAWEKEGGEYSSGDGKETSRGEEGLGYKVLVVFTAPTGKVMHPISLTAAIRTQVGRVKDARCLSGGRVLIVVDSESQRDKVLKLDVLNGGKVKCQVPGSAEKVRGVITGVPKDLSMEELKKEVSGGMVVEARRMSSRSVGLEKVSPTVLVEFGGPLPSRVRIGCLSFYVREYVPPPLQCFRCQRMGHVAAVCRGQGRCARCGGNVGKGRR